MATSLPTAHDMYTLTRRLGSPTVQACKLYVSTCALWNYPVGFPFWNCLRNWNFALEFPHGKSPIGFCLGGLPLEF